MTTTPATAPGRDDLFTYIHKGLRLGLFELTINVGRTDWTDPAAVTEIGTQWQPLLSCYRIGFNAPGPHQWQLKRGFEKEVNLAGEQVL